MTRRLTAVVLSIGVLAGAAGVAEAAFRAGTYKGKHRDGGKVSLKVAKSKKSLVYFTSEAVDAPCTNGETKKVGPQFVRPARMVVKRGGSFRLRQGRDDGTIEIVVDGKLQGSRASGAIQVQARVNDSGQYDPQGSVTCDSELVAWSARR